MKILQKNKKGFSLVETVLVVGLIALFSVGVYVIYNKVRDSSVASDEAREINSILGSARSLVGNTNVIPVLDAPLLANARIIDSTRVIGLNYTTGTGQQVSFEPVFTTGVNHIKVNYLNTTNAYCAKLANAFQNDVDLITIGGTIVKNTMPLATPMPYDVSTAAATCAASGDSFTMSFNFRR